MKLIVYPHKTTLEKVPVNEKEINITKIEFEFNDIPNEYVKKAFFTLDGQTYAEEVINNECNIPYEVLNKKGQVELGVIAYELDDDEYVARYNPSPSYFTSLVGSLKDNYENSEPITPSDKEQMEQALQSGLNDIQEAITKASRLDIDATKTGDTCEITITKQDNTTKSVEINDGEDGVGLDYNWSGTSLGIKREDEQNYDYVNLQGPVGPAGAIKMLIVNELPQVAEEGTLYFVPKQDTETGDIYDEYMWVNNAWELIGEKQITIDLSDYYTKEQTNALIPTSLSELTDDSTHRLTTDTEKSTWNGKVGTTDYATNTTGGVVKVNASFGLGLSSGTLYALVKSYSDYANLDNYAVISKGTLENVITGKGLVSNTDYATNSVGGVLKISSTYATTVGSSGVLLAQTKTYNDYQSLNNNAFIGKSTLDNVLNAVVGDIDTALDLINGESVGA